MFHFALGKLGAAIKAGTGSAGVVPLFSRDYEATGSLGADATFTRASTATYVDSNGVIQTAAINTPRFDYSTGSRALLMEPAETNYVPSQIITSGAYIRVDTVVTGSAGTAPDGNNTAYKIEDDADAGTGEAFIIAAPNVGAAGQHTFSVFIKKDQSDWVSLRIYGFTSGGSGRAWFNLSTGTVGTIEAGLNSHKMENYGNGWYRCSVEFSVNAADLSGNAALFLASADNTVNVTRDGTNSVFAWGLQVESGSTPTSYIPTSGSAVTRAADALSYSGIAADNETRAITDAGTVDVDDWDGVVDATINGADNLAQISSITVYTTGERPA